MQEKGKIKGYAVQHGAIYITITRGQIHFKKLTIQFLSCTSDTSSAQQPHVAGGFHTEQRR